MDNLKDETAEITSLQLKNKEGFSHLSFTTQRLLLESTGAGFRISNLRVEAVHVARRVLRNKYQHCKN